MWPRIGIFLLLLTAFFLVGMGKMDLTEKPGEIPVPDRDISATLTDIEGLTLALSQFSIGGQTAISGKLGAGRVTIPLSQVKGISLINGGKGVTVKIDLSDASQVSLQLEKGLTVSGRIKAGTYQVYLEQVKKIEILSVSEKRKQ